VLLAGNESSKQIYSTTDSAGHEIELIGNREANGSNGRLDQVVAESKSQLSSSCNHERHMF
jgi:hypothetical protein